MDSKQANRIRSNGIAQGREDSRWMRKRIAELEAERRELAGIVTRLVTAIENIDGDLEAVTLTDVNLAAFDAERLLAKINAQEKG